MEEPRYAHYRWSDVQEEDMAPAVRRQLVTGDSMMLARIQIDAGQVVPTHSHENEQITTVIEGALRFWLGTDDSEVVDVAAGEILQIPSDIPHKAEALERTVSVDIFCPPRQDWLEGSDSYLRDPSS
jgi:quercetin dioxygenase-like cupin family protein